jgi:hypothetical protein
MSTTALNEHATRREELRDQIRLMKERLQKMHDRADERLQRLYLAREWLATLEMQAAEITARPRNARTPVKL